MSQNNGRLIAEMFRNDPQVLEAKELLLKRLVIHQSAIDGVRPPTEERVDEYEKAVIGFSEARGGGLFFPYLGSGIGKGALVELGDGSIKYDFISGIGVHHFGHSNPSLISAGLDAALSDTVMQGNLQQNINSAILSQLLLEAASAVGEGFDHCFLTSTGVMAGENALKIAFQKKMPANRVLAFENCFAGRTISFSQITDKAAYREGIPMTLPVDYIPFYDPANPDVAIEVLNGHLSRYPNQHAAMIFELVQGEGGFKVGTTEFFRPLMQRCRDAGVAVLVDEVQTFARTRSLFASDYFKVGDLVDVVWIGKASQVCATFFRKDWNPRPGLLSQTFTASSAAIEAGCVLIRELTKGGYFGPEGKVVKWHKWLEKKLVSLESAGLVSGPFGVGAMVAFTPYDSEPQRTIHFVRELFTRGVMSFIAGSNPVRVRFLLPVGGLNDEDLASAWEIVEETLRDCEPWRPS